MHPVSTGSPRPRTAILATLVAAVVAASVAPAGRLALAAGRGPSAPDSSLQRPTAPTLPESPAGRQLAWVLAQVNGGVDALSDAELGERFSGDFLAALPPDRLRETFGGLAVVLPPVAVARFEGPVTETGIVALLGTGDGASWRVSIAVEPAPPHRIADLFFAPAPLPTLPKDPPKTWQDFDGRLQRLAPAAGAFAAEVVGDRCRAVHTLRPDKPLAIASAFKLYILGELARQVAAGRASWDEGLAIRDDWKSLPSGHMRDEPSGSVHPLREYALQMISASDNTAADHLIHRLGREQVEAYLAGVATDGAPLDAPLLTTREFFALKAALPAGRVDAYLAASAAEKRRLLATSVAGADLTVAEDATWVKPIRIATVEWFASPADLCRAMATLRAMADQPGLAPLPDLLSRNPGLPLDPSTWSYVGFKGGDETGVMTRTWLLRRADDRWFVLAVGLNDPSHPLDEASVERLLVAATNLLGATP